MLAPLNRKIVAITPPAAISDNATLTTAEIDTAGYDFMVINVHYGAMDIAMAALAVTESDSSGSGHANITGAVFGTSNNDTGSASTLPSATDDNKFFSIMLDLKARKRYIDVTATTGDGAAGTYITIWAELWRAKDAPRTALEAGYAQRLIV